MKQPPRADGIYEEPGKICVIGRAMPGFMPGAPNPNPLWDSFRDMWLQTGAGIRCSPGHPCFGYQQTLGSPGLDVDNDDLLVTAPDEKSLENWLSRSSRRGTSLSRNLHPKLQSRRRYTSCTTRHRTHRQQPKTHPDSGRQQLCHKTTVSRQPSTTTDQRLTHVDTRLSPTNSNPNRLILQHMGLKITKFPDGSIKISDPNVIMELLEDHGRTGCNPHLSPVHNQRRPHIYEGWRKFDRRTALPEWRGHATLWLTPHT